MAHVDMARLPILALPYQQLSEDGKLNHSNDSSCLHMYLGGSHFFPGCGFRARANIFTIFFPNGQRLKWMSIAACKRIQAESELCQCASVKWNNSFFFSKLTLRRRAFVYVTFHLRWNESHRIPCKNVIVVLDCNSTMLRITFQTKDTMNLWFLEFKKASLTPGKLKTCSRRTFSGRMSNRTTNKFENFTWCTLHS